MSNDSNVSSNDSNLSNCSSRRSSFSPTSIVSAVPGCSSVSKKVSDIRLILVNFVVAGLEIASSVAFTFIPPLLLKSGYSETQMSIIFGVGKLYVLKSFKSQDRCFSNICTTFHNPHFLLKSLIFSWFSILRTELQLRVKSYELRFEPRSTTHRPDHSTNESVDIVFELLESDWI